MSNVPPRHTRQAAPRLADPGTATPYQVPSDLDTTRLPIGRRVALWRTRCGMSQQLMADLIGKSKSWVDKVERGERALDKLSVICNIADVLRIDLLLLLLGHPDRGPGAAAQRRRAPVARLDLGAARRDIDTLMYRHLKPGHARTIREHTRLMRGVLTFVYAAMATEGVPLPTRCRVIVTVLHRHRGARP